MSARRAAAATVAAPAVPAADGGVGPADLETLVDRFRQLVLIRRVEEAAYDLFVAGLVRGSTHLAIGQEAVAVGAAAALRPTDYSFCTYRGHHHVIARGGDPEACLAELMSRSTGICGAKGGSMHLTAADHNVMGSYAIVGAHIPMACGAAWSAKLRGTDQVAVVFFGDGATNIGAFHEALNLASVWKLPVVFVCENNLYMEYTPIASVTAVAQPAADRAPAYALPAEVVDGNDVGPVYEAVSAAAARARQGGGPTVVEALTYRHHGHSRADPGTYRPPEEVEAWKRRDPLLVAREALRAAGATDEAVDEADAEVTGSVQASVERVKQASEPDVAVAFTDVWADGGSAWRT